MMRPSAVVAALAMAALIGCSSNAIVGLLDAGSPETFAYPGRSIQIALDQELPLTIRTVGPGEYASPPEMNGEALRFLDVSLAAVQVPAGPTQIFHFVGTRRGTTVVRFHGTGSATVVADTVIVR